MVVFSNKREQRLRYPLPQNWKQLNRRHQASLLPPLPFTTINLTTNTTTTYNNITNLSNGKNKYNLDQPKYDFSIDVTYLNMTFISLFRFNNLNQQNVNNKNAVNDLNQRMGVLGLKPSEASLFHTGSNGMSNSGAVTNLASTNSQQEAHQQLCGNTADSLYKIDYLMDPRKSVSIEQLAAYVSS